MNAPVFDFAACFADRAERMQASEIRELLKLLAQPDIISFAGGIPDPNLFPTEAMTEAYRAVLDDPAVQAKALQYSISEGYPPLRQWIADYMATLGVPCSIDNILITSGSQQALDFLGRLFLSPGDTALVAAPTWHQYREFLAPVATEDIGFPRRFHQSRGYLAQHVVAHTMAMGVIN